MKFCIHVYDISLYINCFSFQSDKNWLLWQLKVPNNLKWEKWKLAISEVSLGIFRIVFTEMLIEQPFMFRMNYCQIAEINCLLG